jgi:hypothetical protein
VFRFVGMVCLLLLVMAAGGTRPMTCAVGTEPTESENASGEGLSIYVATTDTRRRSHGSPKVQRAWICRALPTEVGQRHLGLAPSRGESHPDQGHRLPNGLNAPLLS